MPFVEGGLVEDVPQSAPASGFVEGGLVEDPTPEDSYNIVRGFTSGTHDYIPTKKDFLQYEQVSSEKPYPWGQLPGAVAEMGKELVVGLPQKAAETVAEAVYQPSVADARAMLGATQAEVALRSAQRAKDIGMGLIDTILNQYDKATGATGEESDQKRYERFLARADIKRNLIRAQTGQHPSVDVQTMETLGIPTEAISQPGVQVGEFIAAPENIAFAGGGKLAGMALQAGGRALPSVGGAVRAAGEKIYNVAGFPERFAGSAATALTGSEAAGLRASQAVAAGSAALTGAELAGVEGISASIPVLPTLAKGISAGKAAGATLETLGEAAQVSGGPTLSAAQQFLLNAGERIAVAPGASEATKALGTFIARSGVEAPAVAAMKILIPAAGGGIAGGLFAGLTGEEKDAIVHATGGGIAFGALDSAFTLAKAAAAGSFKGQRVRAAAEADLNARPETAQFTFVDNLGNTTDSTLNDKASRAALYSKLDDAQLTKTLSEVANAEAAGTDVVFHDSSAQLPKGIDAISYKGVYIPPESIKSGRPTILINVDKVSPETLPHELVHARVTPDFIKEVSSNVLEGKIDQVQFTDFANKYANQLEAAGSKQLADNMRDELVQAFNPQNSRAQRIDAAKNIVNEFTSYYTQEWLAGKDAKKLLPGRIPAWYETAFNKAKEVVADKFSRRALQAGFDPVSRSFYDASGKRLRIPWMEDSIDKLVAKNQGFEGVDRKVDTRSLSRGEREALIQSKGWTDLYQLAPDGSIQRPLTGKEVATKTAEIAKKTTDVLEAMPKDKRASKTALDDKGNPVIQGRLSPEEAKAISDSGIFSPSTSRFLIEMAKGMEEGNLYDSKYWKVYGRSGKAGVFGESSKTILPYAISINSKGGVNIKVVDWSKVQGRMQAALNKPQYKNLFRNYDDAYRTMRDVYLKNLADPLSQTASAEALGGGVEGNRKRNFFNEVMGAVPKVADVLINPATAGYQSNRKAGSVYVDLRIERIQDLVNNGEKIPWSGDMGESSSYRRTQLNWQPAEQIGDTIAKSDSVGGFRIISAGDKFRLYAPSGEKVGIFDTEGQAKLKAEKAYATNQRIQPEVGQQEYQPRDEVRQAAEAGDRNRVVSGTQGGEEGGQALGSVRQARDVIVEPGSETFTIPKSDIVRFMPASDKVRLEDYADRKIIALAADRMGIGQMIIGPKESRRELSVQGQGGRGFMNIFNGGGWAFSDKKTADRFLKRLKKESDKSGNAIVGITVQSPINHLKNQTGQLAYIEAMQAAIDSGVITKKAADEQVAVMSSAIVNSTAKSVKLSAREKFNGIRSFNDLKNAITNKQLNFADMEPLLKQMQRKKLPITEKELKAAGISPADIARDIADPELLDIPFGSVVALLQVNVKQLPENTGFHYAYPWTVNGEAIGYLDKFYNISDLSTEKKIRNKSGVVTAQPLQTVMPVMDNIINTIKTKQGIPSTPSARFKATSEDIRYMPETIQRDVGRNQDFANPPTDTEAVDALSSEKKAKFGAARSIKPGTQVAARIDIPAFLRTGKYVVAVHEPDGAAGGPGKVIGYDTVTRLQNPKFVVKPGVQRIYEGKSAKFPVATVDGKIMSDRSIPADLENYVPVGMDPKEHAYFYDKRTDQPVIGGSESVSVGNTVFVKNPVYGDPSQFAFMPSPDSAMPGAYSFPGGYRALPAKAKGKMRVYGPLGQLVGIASSLDEAQRMVQRKLR